MGSPEFERLCTIRRAAYKLQKGGAGSIAGVQHDGVVALGRRGVKEYRAPEALILIAADREHKPLVCPSCGSDAVVRTPPRDGDDSPGGRVTLRCSACSRSAVYIDRIPDRLPLPETPSKPPQPHR
jgi:hypothetical protein